MSSFPLISKLDKLDEIYLIYDDEYSSAASKLPLSKEVIDDAKFVGTVDKEHVLYVKHDGLEIFFTLNKEQPEMFLTFQEMTLADIHGYMSTRAYVPKEKSGMGHMGNMFGIARDVLKKPIFSDEKQTAAGNALWKALARKYDVKVLDFNNKQILPMSEVPDDLMFSRDKTKALDYIFIIEGLTKNQTIMVEAKGYDWMKSLEPMTRLFGEGDF